MVQYPLVVLVRVVCCFVDKVNLSCHYLCPGHADKSSHSSCSSFEYCISPATDTEIRCKHLRTFYPNFDTDGVFSDR